jgi:hypothetical protein
MTHAFVSGPLALSITVALLLPGCFPEQPPGDRDDGGSRTDAGVILPSDHPLSVALNDCFAMCRRIAEQPNDCPGTPTLKDCARGCIFSAKISRCTSEFAAWTSCGKGAAELTCDSEKREPSFVGCEAARDTFRGCVGEVL